MAQTRGQKVQAELDELKTSEDTLRRKAEELERTLAVKEEELSNAVLKSKTRTVVHVETVAELSSLQDALKESQRKCAALDESLHTKLQEREENHQRELRKKEESVKQMMEEEYEKKLEERQQKFNEDLQRKEEAMRQERFLLQEKFAKQQIDREKQLEEVISKKEEWLEEQLRKREEDFSDQLTAMLMHWMRRTKEMCEHQNELEDLLQESIRKRDQEEEKIKEEIHSLSEEMSQLQVRPVNLSSSFKQFSMIIKIKKRNFFFLQLQMEKKKKKKCFLRRLWDRLK